MKTVLTAAFRLRAHEHRCRRQQDYGADNMDVSSCLHDLLPNCRVTPRGRERIALQVASGQTPKAVSEAAGVCPRTVRKWVERYRREGPAGLHDRSSRPHRLYRPTPQAIVDQVAALRRHRCTGKPDRGASQRLAGHCQPILRRLGLTNSRPWSRRNRCAAMSATILAR